MSIKDSLQVFEGDKVRTAWDDEKEKWYFSIVDVVGVLTESPDPSKYWRVLKTRLKKEGNETATNCSALKMLAADGKMRKTDVADLEQMFRIIQSIPSPKAEPVKMWMAKVASERVDQMIDPELNFDQMVQDYRRQGYSDKWINNRIRTIEIRKDLTDEWQRSGVQGQQYATLTDIMYNTWAGMTNKQYKQFKGIGQTKLNLRDHMTNTELVLNALAEVSATELSKKENPRGFNQSKRVAVKGGEVAREAKESLEKRLGSSVISPLNALGLKGKDTPEIEDGENNS